MVNRLRVDGPFLPAPAAIDDARGRTRLESDRYRSRCCRASLLSHRTSRSHRASGRTHRTSRSHRASWPYRRGTWARIATPWTTAAPGRTRRRRVPIAHPPLGPFELLLDGPFREHENEKHDEIQDGHESCQHVPTRVTGFGDDFHLADEAEDADHDQDHGEAGEEGRHLVGNGDTLELTVRGRELLGARGTLDGVKAVQC
jgi:hypothetical protein